jgi:peptidoglycan/xylan/chitin deacetylase (PgdA/CDA1 family)
MRPTARLLRTLGLGLALALGCTADPEDFAHEDDAEEGDSQYGVDEAAAAPGVRVPASLSLETRNTVYLTFDDGPSARYTRRIMAVLAAHHAPAAFFVTGANIAGNEAILREESAAGHRVANHQWSHVVATSAQFTTFLTRERDALDRALGAPHPRLFRYPYGSGSTAKEAVVRANGYPDGGIGWNVDTLDWCFGPDAYCDKVPTAYRRDYVGWVVSEARRTGGGVMLFHDIQGITATNLDAILTRLEGLGYRFGALPSR